MALTGLKDTQERRIIMRTALNRYLNHIEAIKHQCPEWEKDQQNSIVCEIIQVKSMIKKLDVNFNETFDKHIQLIR